MLSLATTPSTNKILIFMEKKPADQLNPIFFTILGICSNHNLTRKDFFFINNKGKEKRVDSVVASELLLARTCLKNLRVCLHTRVSFVYLSEGLYGPFSENEVKWLIARVLEKLKTSELIKPTFIDQIFKALKNNSQVGVSGAMLLLKK